MSDRKPIADPHAGKNFYVPTSLTTPSAILRRRIAGGILVASLLSGIAYDTIPGVSEKVNQVIRTLKDKVKTLDIGDAFISFR